jgi:hypothetical protein
MAATELVYSLKRVNFTGRSTPIVLQNVNGPCPLLAIGAPPVPSKGPVCALQNTGG